MSLIWPTALLLFVSLPLILLGYWWSLRRRRRYVVRYSSLSLIREALPRFSQVRRHLPFALFLVALAALIVALSRPVTLATVPSDRTTIIMAIDVSRSMLSDDIPPTRLDAAAQAALEFIQRQPENTQIGLVGFAGFAEMIQVPTTDRQVLEEAVLSLTTGRGTAIGAGIQKSVDVIAEFDPSIPPISGAGALVAEPVPEGAYVPAIIVLLTDGVQTTGPDEFEMAQLARDRGIRVYTIGFGTEAGGNIPGFGGGGRGNDPGFGGGQFRRGIDEDTLKEIAEMTDGSYYAAASAGELQQVLNDLPTSLIARTERTEVSAYFVALGVLLAGFAIGMSFMRHII
ncbi:MAG: VWA domain-containing protein [Roseiflexaceae bacterium]